MSANQTLLITLVLGSLWASELRVNCWMGSQSTVVCVRFSWTVLNVPVPVDWSVVCSSYFCLIPLAEAFLRPETNSRDFSLLLRIGLSTDDVAIAGNLSAQMDYLAETEWHIGSSWPVIYDYADSGNRLIRLWSDHRPFLMDRNLCHKNRHHFTWLHPPASRIHHIIIDHWWRESIKDCWLFWFTFIDPGDALFRARVCVLLDRGRHNTKFLRPKQMILDDGQQIQI